MRELTNITVSVLDLTGLFAQAMSMRRASEAQSLASGDEKGAGDRPVKRIYSPTELAYVKTSDKLPKLYVLDDEGTGHEVTRDEPYELSLWGEFAAENPLNKDASFHQFLYSVRLTPNQILGTTVLKEQELGQFIRTFGNRLDRNFEIWRKTLLPYFPLTSGGE